MGRLVEGATLLLSLHPASAIESASASTTLAREIHRSCLLPSSVIHPQSVTAPHHIPAGPLSVSTLILKAELAGHLHESALAEIFLVPAPRSAADTHQGLEFV